MFSKQDQIQGYDDALLAAMNAEEQRQEDHIELIASENYTSKRVMEAQGSGLTNKYADGYPGKRYYGGCEHVDKVEALAIDRGQDRPPGCTGGLAIVTGAVVLAVPVGPAVVGRVGYRHLLQERRRRRGAVDRCGMGNEAAVFDFQRVTDGLGEGIEHSRHSTGLPEVTVRFSRPAADADRAAGVLPDTAAHSAPGWHGPGRAGLRRGAHGSSAATGGGAGVHRRPPRPARHPH